MPGEEANPPPTLGGKHMEDSPGAGSRLTPGFGALSLDPQTWGKMKTPLQP